MSGVHDDLARTVREALDYLDDAYTWDAKKAVDALIARAEAAEARCERLQQALRAFFDEWDGDVGTYAPTDDTEALMREALAGLDTPADSQPVLPSSYPDAAESWSVPADSQPEDGTA